MSQNAPILSVICVFRNRKEWIESTLQAVYSLEQVAFELLIIDDGSTDGSQDTLRSLVEHHRHEDTFLFENLAAKGRGNSINSALEMARGQFLWMPERVDEVDETQLSQALEHMEQTQALFGMVVPDELAVTPMDWLQLLYNDRLPYDRDCLFHLRKMQPYFRYTDPHWSVRHASEWAIRLHSEAEPAAIPAFCKGDTSRLEMDDRSRKECALSLMRIPGLSLSGQEKAFRMLRSYGSSDHEKDTGSMDLLFEEAQLLFKAGNSVRAMELLDRILAADPAHRRARDFKVEILAKLRRYVEAAEVKHGYRQPPKPDSEPLDQQSVEKSSVSDDTDQTTADSEHVGDSEHVADSDAEPEPQEDTVPQGDEEGKLNSGADASQDTAEEASTETQEGERPETEDDAGLESVEDGSPQPVAETRPTEQQLNLTIIIPTAGAQRQTLQRCLDSVIRYTEGSRTEIIIVDNASLDDTDSIITKGYSASHTIVVLRNEENIGFAGAVNQGLSRASNEWVVVMHNDVVLTGPVPGRLVLMLKNTPSAGLVVPMADHTWNRWQHTGVSGTLFDEPVTPWPPQQHRLEWLFGSSGHDAEQQPVSDSGHDKRFEPEHAAEKPDHTLLEVPFVETFCMALRNEPGLAMSKLYGLGYFDDVDLCLRIQRKNKRVLIARNETVKHLGGRTSHDLGLAMPNKSYWRNLSVFQNEWELSPVLPDDFDKQDPLRKLVLLGERINAHVPEKPLLDVFETLFTSELRTRMLNTRFTPGHLEALIYLMMATNQREVLRKLEEQLDPLFPNHALYHDLVLFYFDRTIYSRCKLYIDRLEPSSLPFHFKLLQLGIAIGEKDYTHAAALLQPLMDELPTHPQVLASAAEMHRKSRNPDQAAKFSNLAQRLNPYLKAQNSSRS